MSATVKDPSIYGPEHVGKKWSVEVMSYLRFDGDRVCFEADFHDKGSRARSLGHHADRAAPPFSSTRSVTTCGGAPAASSWSPGVNSQRPVHTRRRNRQPSRRAHDDVVVVAAVPAQRDRASARVYGREELALHVHLAVGLERRRCW